MSDNYEILTTDKVMDYLFIGRNTIYELLRSGKIKGFKIGLCWKIPQKSLRLYYHFGVYTKSGKYPRNIEENVIRMIIRISEYENAIDYIRHNLIRTLYNDIKHLSAKHRPIIPLSTKDCYTMIRFSTPRMSEKEASHQLDKHYDEIKPIIDKVIEKNITEIPECEGKDITIPYSVPECAIYAIMYSSPEQTPAQVVRENLLDEVKKESRYLIKWALSSLGSITCLLLFKF